MVSQFGQISIMLNRTIKNQADVDANSATTPYEDNHKSNKYKSTTDFCRKNHATAAETLAVDC